MTVGAITWIFGCFALVKGVLLHSAAVPAPWLSMSLFNEIQSLLAASGGGDVAERESMMLSQTQSLYRGHAAL